MSGIYIPGMEMPKTGLYFVSVDNSNGQDKTVITVERMLGNRDVRQTVGSFELVPVPPHGRLIDERWLKDAMITTLEALKKNPKMDKQEMHLIAAFDTLRAMVEDAPTIIPADPAKEGKHGNA